MRIPTSTYRLQLNSRFDFAAAGEIVDYLWDLGISDIYASPVFKAVKESPHGYDVVDPLQINPELGGQAQFDRLIGRVRAKNMGWLQDIVPNHMAFDPQNSMLMDVMENGPASPFINFFDVQFDHPYENLRNKILAPFLGEFYGQCLDKRQIQIKFSEAGFTVQYFNLGFPLRIGSYLTILTRELNSLSQTLGQEGLLKFLEVTESLKAVSTVVDPQERLRQVLLIKSRLWRLYGTAPKLRAHLDGILEKINNGQPASSHDLDKILSEQFFRLAFWKVGNEELNYRRFFTVNSLMCLRMDRYETFEYTHRLAVELMAQGKFTGLRIDHLDGLYDPAGYLKNLRQKVGDAYIVVEKILDPQEHLPAHLNIQGTTGYDFLNFVNGLQVQRSNEGKMQKMFQEFTAEPEAYRDLVASKKRLFIGRYMAGDIDNLALLIKNVLNRSRYGKDLTMYGLRRALVEIMTHFPIYRTYIDENQLSPAEKGYIKEALAMAVNFAPAQRFEIEEIGKVLLLDLAPETSPEEKQDWLHFVRRFQQFTGPLMAKGAEDTTFYIYNRLISLNEVGNDPGIFGTTAPEFHEFNQRSLGQWPHTLNATATHDTKRGEDVRSRINVLSEIPREWQAAVKSWHRTNQKLKQPLERVLAPDNDDEYFIYQTLIGAYPFEPAGLNDFVPRMKEYIIKAVREAKVHTGWVKPDEAYEQACVRFIERILVRGPANVFLKTFVPLQHKIAFYGVFNSLAQTLLKMASPGVPDFYQGCELWDLSLVDPDNRRPVDFRKRKEMLADIKARLGRPCSLAARLLKRPQDGGVKMFLVHQVLAARRQNMPLFENGNYMPLEAVGRYKPNLLGFCRRHNDQWVLALVPRFLTEVVGQAQAPLGPKVWKDTAVVLPQGAPAKWKNVITGEGLTAQGKLPAAEALAAFPVGCWRNA